MDVFLNLATLAWHHAQAMVPPPLAVTLTLIAAHHWQEAACGHHARPSCASLRAAALAYAAYAAKVALGR